MYKLFLTSLLLIFSCFSMEKKGEREKIILDPEIYKAIQTFSRKRLDIKRAKKQAEIKAEVAPSVHQTKKAKKEKRPSSKSSPKDNPLPTVSFLKKAIQTPHEEERTKEELRKSLLQREQLRKSINRLALRRTGKKILRND